MPRIQQITTSEESLSFTDSNSVTNTLLYSDVPSSDLQGTEDWINNWLNSRVVDCQVICHVYSINPFQIKVGTFNTSNSVPSDWWVE